MPGIHGMELEKIWQDDKQWVTLLAYEELKRDLDAANQDIRELRRGKKLLKSEIEEITRIRQERTDMKEREDKLALFLREHYSREISLGQHTGLDLVDVVIRYLGRERMHTQTIERVTG